MLHSCLTPGRFAESPRDARGAILGSTSLVATLAAIGRRHSVIITALQSDHAPGTNHEAGRAMDIGAVDGERCDGRRTGACARLMKELAAMEGALRSTELIYCWDADGSADPRGFARADHCDHIHWGLDR
jgi:hypothetical protein